jgi:hypothetical protein
MPKPQSIVAAGLFLYAALLHAQGWNPSYPAQDRPSNGVFEMTLAPVFPQVLVHGLGEPLHMADGFWAGVISVTLKNVSRSMVRFDAAKYFVQQYTCQVLDSSGKPVPLTEWGRQNATGPWMLGGGSRLDLPPGEVYKSQIPLHFMFAIAPGQNYTVKVKCSKWLPALDASGQPLGEVSVTLAIDGVPQLLEAVDRYARYMGAVVNQGLSSLETAFEEGMSVATVLQSGQLAQLDGTAYLNVRDKMVGFKISREGAIVAAPLPDFFLPLARAKGSTTDQAFFEALKQTYPSGVVPAYYNALTDTSACAVSDEAPAALYGVWIAFQKSHPGAYPTAVKKELTGMEQAMESQCVCGGEGEVRNQLEDFLKAYPSSPAAGQLASRLQALENHASDIRFYCRAY